MGKKKDLKNGFYWVKSDTGWEVMEYSENKGFFDSSGFCWYVADLKKKHIGERVERKKLVCPDCRSKDIIVNSDKDQCICYACMRDFTP